MLLFSISFLSIPQLSVMNHNYLLKPVNQTELNRNLREIYNQLESDISETASSAERISGSTMEDIREYIEINYATNITLNRLSKDFFFSKEHISRSFRQKYGVRLFDYVNECRLKHVCDLLKRTDMSIDEIAIRCGFSCGNYLRKVFKKQYGVAPSEYRLAH